MSIESMLRDVKSIQERYISDAPKENPESPKEKEQIEPDELEKASEKEAEKEAGDEVFSKEIDNIDGESPEAIKETLDMLVSVSIAASERIKSIFDKIVEDESFDLNEIITDDLVDKLSEAIQSFEDIEVDISSLVDDAMDDLPDEDELQVQDEVPDQEKIDKDQATGNQKPEGEA